MEATLQHTFDRDYWEAHWQEVGDHGAGLLANPYLAREIGDLALGTALDAGCGEGAEATWLAVTGWHVTAADISPAVLARAADRAAGSPRAEHIDWIEADLSVWQPDQQFDLVMTHLASGCVQPSGRRRFAFTDVEGPPTRWEAVVDTTTTITSLGRK
jgi:2-polyprenyl-3-methyl-5-hydroxy-6-metoxy-1,4-benzoquinol methylase